MINFDRFIRGKFVTTGIAIAATSAMIALLPACSPGDNPPTNNSSPISSPISSPVANSTSNPVASSTPNQASSSQASSSQASNGEPSPGAIASPTPQTKTSESVTPNPSSSVTPNSFIDYGGKTSREYWVVTDPDPKGLNCRWSSSMPKDWTNPSAKLPPLNIQEWPAVRQFPKNTELKANNSPAGLITIADENGKPWLKVSMGDNNQICLVRANSQFIQPKQ